MVEEKISKEDLDVLTAAKVKYDKTVAEAKRLISETKVAELECSNEILKLFVKYSLSFDDGFDDTTGVITRKPQVAEAPAAVETAEEVKQC